MSDPNDLSAREMEVLALAWQCMESEPKVSSPSSTSRSSTKKQHPAQYYQIDNKKLAELTGVWKASASDPTAH
jgi:hypothetical protein